jgi:hypothetical protein
VGQKTKGKSLDMSSRLKDFMEENSAETSDTGTDQCIKNHAVNMKSTFSIYFQKQCEINTNRSRIHSMLIRPKITNFLLKDKTILTLQLILF